MDFVVIGRDGDDAEAPARRASAREAHLALGDEMKAAGSLKMAAALLNDAGAMVGSVLVLTLPDRAAVDAYLEQEPYVAGGVWKTVDVHPAAIGPAFRG